MAKKNDEETNDVWKFIFELVEMLLQMEEDIQRRAES